MREVEFAILGAGALGTILAAQLVRAGHSVALLARGKRAKELEEHGLRIRGLVELDVALHPLTDPSELRHASVFIVTTKARNTWDALAPFHNAEIATALSLQNGVVKDEILSKIFGPTRVLGALANLSGELLPSGEVLFTRNVNLLIGELNNRASSRASKLSSDLASSGIRATVVEDIQQQEWSKFAAWVALASLSVATRATTGDFLNDPGAALVAVRLIREVGQLAAACSVKMTDDALFPAATLSRVSEIEAVEIVRQIGESFRRSSPKHRMSTLQDVESKRPLEFEETLGFAVQRAAEFQLRLPLLEAFSHLLSAVDRTHREGSDAHQDVARP